LENCYTGFCSNFVANAIGGKFALEVPVLANDQCHQAFAISGDRDSE
jgi:hypothetical protein